MAQQQKKEPWKPKEKFDKKSSKKANQQQEETTDAKQTKKIVQPVEEQQTTESKEKIQIDIDNRRKDFLSHLPIYKMHSSATIKPLIETHILHPAFIELCISYQNGNCMGSTYRCVEFLNALKALISDYRVPKIIAQKQSFGMIFNSELEKIFNFVQHFRTTNEGMCTAYAYIRHLMTLLMRYPTKLTENDQKEWLNSQIDQFIQQKIVSASELIIASTSDLIKSGTSILIYARSYLIENFIIQSYKQGKQYQIFIVDNPPFNEGKQLFDRLQNEGINSFYLKLSHVSYILNKVDKILVGASSMLCNGALVSRVGTALLACLAHERKIPFLVLCESYKFSERSQIDSLSWNEIASLEEDQKYVKLSLRYDITQSKHINMVITEVGLIPATSVKAVIKEFKKYNYVDSIELPNKQQTESGEQ